MILFVQKLKLAFVTSLLSDFLLMEYGQRLHVHSSFSTYKSRLHYINNASNCAIHCMGLHYFSNILLFQITAFAYKFVLHLSQHIFLYEPNPLMLYPIQTYKPVHILPPDFQYPFLIPQRSLSENIFLLEDSELIC